MNRIFVAMLFAISTLFCGVSIAQESGAESAASTEGAQSSYVEKIDTWYAGLSEGERTQVTQSAGIALIAVVCVVLILVATRRVVFYYDRADAFWSLSIFLIPLVGAMIAAFLTPENASAEEQVVPNYLIMASFAGSGLACIVSIFNSIKHNNIFIGLIVGVLKIAMGLLMLLTVFGMFSSATDKNRSFGDRAVAVAILGLIFGLLWKLLVNGHEVEHHRQLRAAEAAA